MGRRKNDFLQDRLTLVFEHAAATTNRDDKLYLVPAGRELRIDRALYWNLTGLAEDAENFFAISLKNGTTYVTQARDTETGSGGSIAANTFVTLPLSATDSARVLAGGATLSLELAETGTATLPAGRVVIEARLI